MSKPNYRKQAMGLAALGRGPDNALVHMSRGEVASLQKIANTAGGSLSINPKTGLPEAGFLNSILPMIAGGVATIFSGGTLAPILAGAVTGALTGDKDQSLLMRAGLGALGGWGGAGVAQGLAGVGASAGKEAASAATQEALKNTTGEVTKQLGADALKTNAGQALGQGVQALGTEGGRQAFMAAIPGGKLGLAAAGAPVAAEAFKQPTLEAAEAADPMYYVDADGNPLTFDSTTGTYSDYDRPGKFVNTYPGMAEGGEVPPPDPMAQTRAYYQGLLTPKGSTPPSSQALLDYMNNLNTNVVQTPVPARPTPPPADTTSTVATPAATAVATQPMSYGKKVKKKTVQVPLPGYSYDQATGTYAQTSGPTGGVTNPDISADLDRFLRKDSNFLRPFQKAIRKKLASQGVAGYAAGGPTYAAGGKLLRGPGDGMSDSIPAVIGGTQRAALADGEFVMPADVVAHLGNGSTTAGAGRLYEMMDRVRKARTGSTTQPPAVNMGRLMPA
jgi:hypothetical protein